MQQRHLPQFNPRPRIQTVPIGPGAACLVVDDALLNPDQLVELAVLHGAEFTRAAGSAYPGFELWMPPAFASRLDDFFRIHLRGPLGGRRTLGLNCRLSMVTVPPHELDPRQWQCHRDRVADDPREFLFAASVLYLFREPRLGGTSFYVPRQAAAETDRLVADSQLLDARGFGARYGLQAGYMAGSNAYFERAAQVGAAWNRMIFYDGGLFHSGDVDDPQLLSTDPTRGRLTLNAFFTCKRSAR